ncbi:TetR/AcrR family transcriptional regulator [Actinoplanes sp. L3-i22]|uniref:TetR/AcrR family transcriptional regulator n=1 Tax=Actinoplanes sp. L3-i22 TaxID=2836373 RepID=UPI001C7425BE|nr:TetR/AcrR family transcriptional regulator [Actinoplanes sp. L3-i22]BCY10341.1 TetR family transcriptional regulator [Actinoplanes sp. L3-i22]
MARTPIPGTRDNILSAASDLFYRNGVRAVGMAQVIEAAGCGKGLLYRHFPSKADLAAAYLRLVRARRDASIAAALTTATDPAGQLIALVTEVADLVQSPDYRGCAFRNHLIEFPGEDDAPARVAKAYLRDTRAQVDTLVERLGQPAKAADRIWLLIGGLHGGDPAQAGTAVEWVTELVTDSRKSDH